MNILSSFFADDLAIDLGTVNTIIYTPTQGVVLNEPSILAVHKYSREVLSVGASALKMLGREPNDTEVHRPIRRGAIDQEHFRARRAVYQIFHGAFPDLQASFRISCRRRIGLARLLSSGQSRSKPVAMRAAGSLG